MNTLATVSIEAAVVINAIHCTSAAFVWAVLYTLEQYAGLSSFIGDSEAH